MHFKTSAEIKAEKEMGGRGAKREEEQKQRAAERASQKYARMAEESAKREAAAKLKPKLVVRPGVIEAPALLEARRFPPSTGEGGIYSPMTLNVVTTPVTATTKKLSKMKLASPAPDAKLVVTPPTQPMPKQPHREGTKVPAQRWDPETKQWVKL